MYRLRSPAPCVKPSRSFSGAPRRLVVLAMMAAIAAGSVVYAQQRAADQASSAQALAIDKKIMDEAKSHSEIMKNLQYLSDVVGPRLTGSANLKKANEWTAETMRSYGLSNVHL